MLQAIYYLEKKDARKDGKLPLKVRIYRSRKEFIVIGLKIYLLPTQWNGDKIVNTLESNVLTSRLNFYRLNIGRVLLDIDTEGGTASMHEIRDRVTEAIGKKAQSPSSFFAYFENYISGVKSRKTAESFRLALSKVKKYDSSDRSFSDITAGWLRNFERFCVNDGLAVNSISIYLRNIRTVYNRAIDDNVAQLNDYPFRRFKIKQGKTRKRALTVDQVRELRDYPCTPAQSQYRDLFILILYLRGINVVDLFGLAKIDSDGYIYYVRAKTKRHYAVKVEPEALKIIKRYKGRKHLLSFADRYKNHEQFITRMNRSLKTIGAPDVKKKDPTKPGPPKKEAKGIFPDLTTYWARHSWASVAAGLDIPKETIAAGLGHEIGNPTTSIYIDFDQRKVDAANRKIIDHLNGDLEK